MANVPYEEGFFLQASDGFCFDGERFKACSPRDYTLRWSVTRLRRLAAPAQHFTPWSSPKGLSDLLESLLRSTGAGA